MEADDVLFTLAVFFIGTAFVSVVLTGLLSAKLKKKADSLQRQVYGSQFRLTGNGNGRSTSGSMTGTFRAYALILRAHESYVLNRNVPTPSFVEEELRSCSNADLLQNVKVKYDSPTWLLFDRNRVSDRFVEDLRLGEIKHVAMNGLPCRARLPTPMENDSIHTALLSDPTGSSTSSSRSSRQKHAILFASTSHSSPIDEDDSGCNSVASRLYPFRKENDDEPWESITRRLFLREESAGNSSTSMHVFGYSVV